MNSAKLLKDLLGGRRPSLSSATVSAVQGSSLYVIESGQTRVATIIAGDATAYKPGDIVKIQGSVVVGRVSPRKSKVVYV